MKKNTFKTMAVIAVFISSLIVISCDTEQFSLIPDEKIEQENRIELRVSKEDAMRVAAMFVIDGSEEMDENGITIRRGSASAAANGRSVQNLSIIQNNRNEPAMFVINYADNEGFILVSASRAFYPVLAHSCTGSFVISDDMPGGLLIWMEQIKAEMEYQKRNVTESTLSKFNALWRQFEDREEENAAALAASKNAMTANSNICLWTEMSFWINQGYTVMSLGQFGCPEFISWAQAVHFPAFDYMTYSFVAIKEYSSVFQRGPFLTTQWWQGVPFNLQLQLINGTNPPLGSSTIAMGQIMAYHRWPAHFNWNSILIPGGHSVDTQLFLRNIALAIGTNFSFPTPEVSINVVSSTFRNTYGYSSTISVVNHNRSSVVTQLSLSQPVYMRGEMFDIHTQRMIGHAWVCDGYRAFDSHTQYLLRVPVSWWEYATVQSRQENHSLWYLFHMNWGWVNGMFNGWFLGENVNANNDDRDFRHNRRNIINIRR